MSSKKRIYKTLGFKNLMLKVTLSKLSLKIMRGHGAFYYWHEEGELRGAVLTHVDDLILSGNVDFIEKIRAGIADALMVSMVEKDKFRFTSWDIEKYDNQVRATRKDYAKSIERITEIRKGDNHHDSLSNQDFSIKKNIMIYINCSC